MASTARKSGAASQAELVLLPSLKNCLLNLPSSLVGLLLNSNAIVQNVIVELSFRRSEPYAADGRAKGPSEQQSIFLGWTGMRSQTRTGSLIRRDGSGRQDSEIPTVEIDSTYARLLGLSEGTKVTVSLHVDPPQAHTVNIEPLTPTDWEIIELHARFLEMNFISQVRALPNPTAGKSHPLTLHLSPTSTASIIVISLTPSASAAQPFVKLAPDAEVIVAPKTRQAERPSSSRDNRSVTSASRRSAGGRSEKSASRQRSTNDAERARPPLFLRGLGRGLGNDWFEPEGGSQPSGDFADQGLRVWLDREHLHSKTIRGVTWVSVSIVKPTGLQEAQDPQNQTTPDQLPASKVVVRLSEWEDAPDSQHIVLSSLLCKVLGVGDLVGGIVRLEPATMPLPRTASALKDPSQQASKDAIVKKLRVTPYAAAEKQVGFKFGGESKAEKESAAKMVSAIFGESMLNGPLTDGMLLPPHDDWPGGVLDFDPTPSGDPKQTRINWLQGGDRKLEIAMQPETAPPKITGPPGEPLPDKILDMVAIEDTIERARSTILNQSSALLIGGLGSGKTSLAQLLANEMRREYLFHTTYISCRSLSSEETRIKTIKETLQRAFATAAWGARLGGRALLILDDLDRLCPTETELQVDANGRSRQVSELLCSVVRQYIGTENGVVLLATAQSKEGLHNLIIGSHLVREIVALKAPNKDGRRKTLETLVHRTHEAAASMGQSLTNGVDGASAEWMEEAHGDQNENEPHAESDDDTGNDVNYLEIAGQTDGYMPGDLAVLVARARSEALIRAVTEDSIDDNVKLSDRDFESALKGFTPASLRGVTLQSSTTTFASIGGLTETRQMLLETLQYPTTYAPLFAKCPLRLRSGLLLYGYPGCGKTLLASAVAGECGLNFISVKGPEILNKYIGASEKSVRDLFERAEAAKPCVLFFDEFDSIAPKRGHDSTGVTDRVVNMLLTMMDGAEGLSGVYVLAATSRPDLIDPALLRPGRLDKSLICDMPNLEDRLDILQAVSKQLKFDQSVLHEQGGHNLKEVATRTQGYSGADLQAVVYNAHLEAIHDILGRTEDITKELEARDGERRGNSKEQDFTYFQLGEAARANEKHQQPAARLAERARIAAKLSSMQAARRKAKQERHASQGRLNSSHSHEINGTHAENEQEPIIHWQHLQKSLETTRSSISTQEQDRLSAIYREFVVGRNGDMSDGQGSNEIGGRTSLM